MGTKTFRRIEALGDLAAQEDKPLFSGIVGNPPYQEGYGHDSVSRYSDFMEVSTSLRADSVSLIVPARWFTTGKGIENLRKTFLGSQHLSEIVDFPDSRSVFPNLSIGGGVCVFLWSHEKFLEAKVTMVLPVGVLESARRLNEFDVFVRDPKAATLIRKIFKKEEGRLEDFVQSRNPFSINSNCSGDEDGDLVLYKSFKNKKISSGRIFKNNDWVGQWKIFLSKASVDRGGFPDRAGRRGVFSRIEVGRPGSVCTESFLALGPFENEEEARNCKSYLETKFCRYLVSTVLLTQNISRSSFRFVPLVSLQENWTDRKLFEWFNLDSEEVSLIEDSIR